MNKLKKLNLSNINIPGLNKKKIAIVTDTTCDLSDEILKIHNIFLVPLQIVYEAKSYRDRMEITPEKVYELLSSEVPKSSLPLTEDVTKILDKIVELGYTDILYISLSSGLSGTYNAIRLLAMEYTGLNIEVFDSSTLSMGLGFLVLEAARSINKYDDIKAALQHIKMIRKSMSAMFVINTLEYLRKGGRIGRVEGTIGNILNIKPIIAINDEGVYYTLKKAKGRKKSILAMINSIKEKHGDKAINLAIVHGLAKKEAEQLMAKLKETLNIKESFIRQVSPVLGMHTGPGLLGIIAYEV